jgi:cytochrome c
MFSKTPALHCLLLAGAIASCLITRAGSAATDPAFVECAACHSTDGTNALGPTLKGVVGRQSASVPNFAYSNAMKRAQVQWTAAELDKYIADPQGVVPGNAMPYAGMPDPAQRKALIDYLSTQK